LPNRDLTSWLQHWETAHPVAWDMGLTRVAAVAKRLAVKPNVPVITVAGTNGKGSTCALLAAFYQAEGYKVGLFTSPHLLRYNERIQIDGREATNAQLIAAFEAIEAAQQGTSLSYFEAATLAAFYLFEQKVCDVWVLEVGLGGRLDAVNILDADCAVLTTVALDHQNYLGDTRELIAIEKLGITRPMRPLVCGETDPPRVIFEHCARASIPLYLINSNDPALTGSFKASVDSADFDARPSSQWRYRLTGERESSKSGLPFPALRGQFQLNNAATALTVLEVMAERLPVRMASVREGLVQVEWSGRLQVLPGRPVRLLDVAHNPHAAKVLANALGDMGYHPRTVAVFGMLNDKDAAGVIQAMLHRIDEWVLTDTAGTRGRSASSLQELLLTQGVKAKHISTYADATAAYVAAQQNLQEADRMVVFGSFSLVSAALAYEHTHR
jgi:dihydrofolate synthase / folylpolyglutamate synthase